MNMQPVTVQHNLFILSNHVSSFSLSADVADVFARSSSNWGRQTDQHALAVFCLCDNMSVTMKPHSAYSPLCVLKASIWVRCTNKVINLSLFLFCLCVCSRIVDECERDRKGKGEVCVSYLAGGFPMHIYAGVLSCMWAVDMSSSGVWRTSEYSIFIWCLHSFLVKDILYKTAFTSHSQIVLFHSKMCCVLFWCCLFCHCY